MAMIDTASFQHFMDQARAAEEVFEEAYQLHEAAADRKDAAETHKAAEAMKSAESVFEGCCVELYGLLRTLASR